MSFRNLVEDQCGTANSLVQLSSHFVQDKGLSDQGILHPFQHENFQKQDDQVTDAIAFANFGPTLANYVLSSRSGRVVFKQFAFFSNGFVAIGNERFRSGSTNQKRQSARRVYGFVYQKRQRFGMGEPIYRIGFEIFGKYDRYIR